MKMFNNGDTFIIIIFPNSNLVYIILEIHKKKKPIINILFCFFYQQSKMKGILFTVISAK